MSNIISRNILTNCIVFVLFVDVADHDIAITLPSIFDNKIEN